MNIVKLITLRIVCNQASDAVTRSLLGLAQIERIVRNCEFLPSYGQCHVVRGGGARESEKALTRALGSLNRTVKALNTLCVPNHERCSRVNANRKT